jgi:hypothetical protein
MAYNKIDFINDLLSSERIEVFQKEKLFTLTANELKKHSEIDKNIFAELEAIKKQLNGFDSVMEKSKNHNIKKFENPKDFTIYHKPEETSKFLQSLSSDSNPLKFIIHDKTNGFEYYEMQEEWKNILTNYKTYFTKNIKYNVIKRMKEFVGCEPKNWFFKGKSENFKLSNEEVINWCKKNPGKHPILHFDNEISYFKESIKIKKGSLQNIIEEVLLEKFDKEYRQLKLNFIDLDKAEFYTDVDALISGLKNIISSIKQRIDQSQSIKFSFEAKATSNGRMRIIKIIHIDSECDKALIKEEIFGTDSGGDFKDAEQRFLHICDWSIAAKNPEAKYNKLNILYDFTNKYIEPREKINSHEIEGFTHILTFYS